MLGFLDTVFKGKKPDFFNENTELELTQALAKKLFTQVKEAPEDTINNEETNLVKDAVNNEVKEETKMQESISPQNNSIITLRNNDKINVKMSLELLKQITLIDAKGKLEQVKLSAQEELLEKAREATNNLESRIDEEINQKLMHKLDILKEHLMDIEQGFEARLELIKENFLQEMKLRMVELNTRFADHLHDLYGEIRLKVEDEIKQELLGIIKTKII